MTVLFYMGKNNGIHRKKIAYLFLTPTRNEKKY